MRKEMRVIFLDRGSFCADELDFGKLDALFPRCQYYDRSLESQVAERISFADIVITNKAVINKDAIINALHLKMILITATSCNNVDLEEARKRQIVVSNVKSYATSSVVQHVFMLVLALARRLNEYSQLIRRKRWNSSEQFCLLDYRIHELAGKTFGIIGYGELGKEAEKVATCFGMNVLIAERKGAKNVRDGRTSFSEVLKRSDVISIHCPLNQETYNLIGEAEFKIMKKSALLINTSRGGIVDELRLHKALVEGRIGGAGIDVLSEEPPVNGNVLIDENLENLIVTPHIAWASIESQQRLLDKSVDNIISFLQGKPINVVS